MSTAELVVVQEDPHLLAVNKPAPLLTQAPPGIDSLEERAKAYLKVKYAKPAGVYLGIPHRLDRPVSGVVLFARNTKAAARVHAQFQARMVTKIYWAILDGELNLDGETVWTDWVRKLPAEARTERAKESEPGAKLAELGVRILGREAGATLVELAPRTGRMHQLRAQCAWRGHPVQGDAQYGSGTAFGPAGEFPRDRVIALHARKLSVDHPFGRGRIEMSATVPEYWPDWAEENKLPFSVPRADNM